MTIHLQPFLSFSNASDGSQQQPSNFIVVKNTTFARTFQMLGTCLHSVHRHLSPFTASEGFHTCLLENTKGYQCSVDCQRGVFITSGWLVSQASSSHFRVGFLGPLQMPSPSGQISWKQNAVEISVQEVYWEDMLDHSCKAVKKAGLERGKSGSAVQSQYPGWPMGSSRAGVALRTHPSWKQRSVGHLFSTITSPTLKISQFYCV